MPIFTDIDARCQVHRAEALSWILSNLGISMPTTQAQLYFRGFRINRMSNVSIFDEDDDITIDWEPVTLKNGLAPMIEDQGSYVSDGYVVVIALCQFL